VRIDILTTAPEMVEPALRCGVVGRAAERGIVELRAVNLRDYATDRHKTTDDAPFGGGGGMVMKIEPIAAALESLLADDAGDEPPARVVLMDPRGVRGTQELARDWATERRIVLLCGRYEGVDERVRRHLVTDEVSVGDYILTGGELAALIVADSLVRLQPGALGDEEATDKDSFSEPLLEYPHYTRPREFRGWEAPEPLLSGNHALIEKWRRWHQLHETRARRPDLFAQLQLSKQDRKLLDSMEPQAPKGANTKTQAEPPPPLDGDEE